MNISVIIPVYNAEKFLQKAIESALQFNEVSEVILVEDGSPDNCLKICKELATKHERVKVFTHPNNENRGAGASRNLGIEKATGDYIAFLDADDFFLPNRFLKDKEVFAKNPDADGCYNAISSFFYDKTGLAERAKFLNTSIEEAKDKDLTTVKFIVPPSSLNKGLLHIIPNFGRFSIIGLTVNREKLLTSKILFPSTSIYEDTNFLIKLSTELSLYSSEIGIAVAKRGVHGDNRITKSKDSDKKYYKNKFILYNDLLSWFKSNSIKDKEIINFLQLNKIFFKILNQRKLIFLIEAPNLLLHQKFFYIVNVFQKQWPLINILRKLSTFLKKKFPKESNKVSKSPIALW